ncbi:hypothetical protein [Botrimarina hoheduenensis]|uniref:Uncharacterized protein n=1 Tax=Botrimarina hoheduenensis TaxID=2528000 RepID=A0A5C5WA40_9BACT|nr:hypothetical protein [Botrimarina hoheduenensis]TWT47520.1 hypothetical protein Pla111_11340 [Botrimarina hoheduenensis]
MYRAIGTRRPDHPLHLESLEPRIVLDAAGVVVGDAQFLRYDDGVFGTLSPSFSRDVATIDRNGAPLAADERRFGEALPLVADLEWTNTGVQLGSTGVFEVLASGWDHDGVTPLMVVQGVSAQALIIYRGNDFTEVARLSYAGGDLLEGELPGRRYVPRAAIVYHGLIVIGAQRYENTASGDKEVGIDFFTTQDLGQTLSLVPQADGSPVTPSYPDGVADGSTQLRTWSFMNPFPVQGIEDTNAAWFPWADYIDKRFDPQGGQVGLFRADRDALTGEWIVRPNRVLVTDWVAADAGGFHVHTAAITTGGVLSHWGDVGYRNKTDFHQIDLENYETAPVVTTTVFGGYTSDTAINRTAPQPVSAAPAPTPGGHFASGDNTPDQILEFGALTTTSDALEIDTQVYQPYRNRSGNRFSGMEILHLQWLQGVGYASGSWVDPMYHFSPDGERWAAVQLPDSLKGRLWLFGDRMVVLNGREFVTAPLPQIDEVSPLRLSPGGTNRVAPTLEAQNPIGAGATFRQVWFQDGLWRYADTNVPLVHQTDPPPFLSEAPVYEVVVGSTMDLGTWYLQPSGQQQSLSESQLIDAWVANLGSQSATVSMNLGILNAGVGGFLGQSGHEVADNVDWTPIGVNGKTGTNSSGRVLLDLSTLTINPGAQFLLAIPYFGELDTPPYPLAPQATGSNELELASGFSTGKDWSAGVVFRWPENAPMGGSDRMPIGSLLGPTGDVVELSVLYGRGERGLLRADFYHSGALVKTIQVEQPILLRGDWVELVVSSGELGSVLSASVAGRTPTSVSVAGEIDLQLNSFVWASRDGATVTALEAALLVVDADEAWTADQQREWLRGSLNEKSVFRAKPAPGDFNSDGVVNAADRAVWEATLFVPNPGGPGDANDDGFVDQVDGDLWREQYGQVAMMHADANCDKVVDVADYTVIRDAMGKPLPPRPGDGNRDGVVDFDDYALWASEYGQTGPQLAMDGNNDGVVDLADYTFWSDNFGATYPNDPADVDRSGTVDQTDYALWVVGYGGEEQTLSADFNEDGIVDLADYTIWRDNRGPQVIPGTGADGSRNGYVDAADLLIWQDALGTIYPTLADLLATPLAANSMSAAVAYTDVPEVAPATASVLRIVKEPETLILEAIHSPPESAHDETVATSSERLPSAALEVSALEGVADRTERQRVFAYRFRTNARAANLMLLNKPSAAVGPTGASADGAQAYDEAFADHAERSSDTPFASRLVSRLRRR